MTGAEAKVITIWTITQYLISQHPGNWRNIDEDTEIYYNRDTGEIEFYSPGYIIDKDEYPELIYIGKIKDWYTDKAIEAIEKLNRELYEIWLDKFPYKIEG